MPPAATRPRTSRVPSTLFVAFELGNAEWKVANATLDARSRSRPKTIQCASIRGSEPQRCSCRSW